MPKYKYKAIDSAGKQKKGSLEADSESHANAQISAMGLMVVELKQTSRDKRKIVKKRGGKKKVILGKKGGRKVSSDVLTTFTRQLATLLQAGLPLLRALDVMAKQERDPAFQAVLVALADHVKGGSSFSEGLAQHPRIFDYLYVNMVKAGEAAGVIDVVLTRLATFMEKSLKTKKKVQSAMVYPAIVCFVAVSIVALLLVFVVPKFQLIFKDMLGDAPMPWLTEQVIMVSTFMKEQIFLTILIIIGAVTAFKYALKTKKGRHAFDWAKLNAPKVGELGSKASISRFTRTFGTLLSSGVPILEALVITRDTIGNVIIENALNVVHDRVRDGETVAIPLEQTNVFPTMVTSMVQVGEETGQLSEMLNRIADNYDEDIDNAVNAVTSIIEPIMIVFLAVVVGTIVIALFLPIIEIIKQLT